ncbi:hypothetical protein ACOMHN_035760 [Nucella lapillus]
MKSTPIQELETITELQPLEDRRDAKLLIQAAKFKRLQGTPPLIQCSIPGVGPKDSQSSPERKSLTLEHLHTQFPKEFWTHVYTDGSAADAIRNGAAGVYVQYPGGREEKICLATGLYSTNYRAEAKALKTAAAHIEVSPYTSHNVVFLTDALSILQALRSNRDPELNDLSSSLASLVTQSPCSGFPPTATCLAMKLLTPWQRKALQKSRWTDKPATLNPRPSLRLSYRTSGSNNIHVTTEQTHATC